MGLDMIMLMVLDQQPQLEIITIPVTQTPVQQLHHIGNGKNLSFIIVQRFQSLHIPAAGIVDWIVET